MSRARILMLVDRPNWAYDFVARSLASRLSNRYQFKIVCRSDDPNLDPSHYDLLYVFFWGTSYYKKFNVPSWKIVKEVSSFRWANEDRYGCLSPSQFVSRYLSDCLIATVTSRMMFDVLGTLTQSLYYVPNGFEPSIFRPTKNRKGPLRVGWVGNGSDPCKGYRDIIIPACKDRFELIAATGGWSRHRVAHLYRNVDVMTIASTAEAQPLTLVESMASGCFPIATDVGIVSELVKHGHNGMIVDRSVDAFREALLWCESSVHQVREVGRFNAQLARAARSWELCAARFGEIIDLALRRQNDPSASGVRAMPTELGTVAGFESAMKDANGSLCGNCDRANSIDEWRWWAADTWNGMRSVARREMRRFSPIRLARFAARRLRGQE